MNMYAYCGNNPVNWVDPWGLKSKENQLSVEEEEKDKIIRRAQKNNRKLSNLAPIKHFPGAPWWYIIPNDCYFQTTMREKELGEWKHWGTRVEGRQKGGIWLLNYGHHVIVVWPKGNNSMEPFVIDVWISKWDNQFNWRHFTGGKYRYNPLNVNYRVEVYSYEEFKKKWPDLQPQQ